MIRGRTGIVIGVLAATVVALALSLTVVLATGDDNDDNDGVGAMRMNQAGYPGMMAAMVGRDQDAMLQHMKEALGDEAFQRMQQHLQTHRNGMPMDGDPQTDAMMHRLMDGMMSEMGMLR